MARPRLNSGGTHRAHDPQRTVANILEVATREFAEKGLAGARIDVIAAAMRTSNSHGVRIASGIG